MNNGERDVKTNALPAVVLFMACLALFANTLANDFIWDDNALIPDNPYIKTPENIPLFFTPQYWNDLHPMSSSGQYRPLRTISFTVDYYLWKLNPCGFHLTNLLLHGINVVLIYCFVTMLSPQKPSDKVNTGLKRYWFFSIPFLTALFFAAHPIHTESINFIKNRSDLLALLFFLTSFILLINYASQQGCRSRLLLLPAALLSFCLAALSKETALTLPAVIIVYALCFLNSQERANAMFGTIPFLGLIGVYIFFQQTVLKANLPPYRPVELAAWQNIITVIKTLGCYLELLILPVNLNAERIFTIPESIWEPAVIASLAALAGCSALAAVFYKKNKMAFFSLCWMFLTIVPVSNIIYIETRPIAEQRLYIPSLGFCLLLAVGINRFFSSDIKLNAKKAAVALVLTASVIVFYSLSTVRRNFDWRDDLTFFSKTVKSVPDSYRVHFNLGAAMFKKKHLEEAVRQYNKALQLEPDSAECLNNLGLALVETGNIEEAVRKFQAAIIANPNFNQSYNNLGLVRMHQGDIDQAIDYYNIALNLKPDFAEALNNLGLALMEKGAFDEAVEKYRAALKINPEYDEAHNNLGVILFKMRRFDEAFAHFSTALKINPEYADGHYNLGVALAADNKIKEAFNHFNMAIEIDPGHMMAIKGLYECKKTIMPYEEGHDRIEPSRYQTSN